MLAALVRGCEDRRPRPQYLVTTPTKSLSILKRVLPKSQLHRLMVRASGAA